jgi:hypothetical protein
MRWFPTTSFIVATRLGARPLTTLLVGLAIALPTNAYAVGDYRDKVAQFAQAAPDKVPCDTCHNDPGGGGPRERPFYLSLEANGLKVSDVLGTITPALEGIAAKKTDSDGDSAPDIAELTAGFSPNNASSKPPPDNTGGGGPAAGAGGSGTPPPPPPPPPPPSGSGGSGAGGRSGAGGAGGKPEPRPTNEGDNNDETELAPGATAQSCSTGGVGTNGGTARGAALLVALAFLTQVRSKRGQGRKS